MTTIPKRSSRDQKTLGELFEVYIDNYARHRNKTWRVMVYFFGKYLDHWRRRPVPATQEWYKGVAPGAAVKAQWTVQVPEGEHTLRAIARNRTLCSLLPVK